MELLTPLSALFLGIVTAASFCAIHALSSVAAYSVSTGKYDKLRPLLIAFGHFSAIILIGFVALGIGLAIETYLIYLQIPAALFILAVGLYLVFAKTTIACGDACDCKTNSAVNKLKSDGLFKTFLFGFSIGLLCVAHVFPLFGTVVAMTVLIGSSAILLLFSYAIGHTLPILAVAYIPLISERFTRGTIEKNIIIVRKVAGIVLIIMGVYFFWGLFVDDHDHDKYHNHYRETYDHYHHPSYYKYHDY